MQSVPHAVPLQVCPLQDDIVPAWHVPVPLHVPAVVWLLLAQVAVTQTVPD